MIAARVSGIGVVEYDRGVLASHLALPRDAQGAGMGRERTADRIRSDPMNDTASPLSSDASAASPPP